MLYTNGPYMTHHIPGPESGAAEGAGTIGALVCTCFLRRISSATSITLKSFGLNGALEIAGSEAVGGVESWTEGNVEPGSKPSAGLRPAGGAGPRTEDRVEREAEGSAGPGIGDRLALEAGGSAGPDTGSNINSVDSAFSILCTSSLENSCLAAFFGFPPVNTYRSMCSQH